MVVTISHHANCTAHRRQLEISCRSFFTRRDFLLSSSTLGAALGLPLPPGERPSTLGLTDYGEGNKQLQLCPRSKTCISTAEAANDDGHYVPPWTYNPTIGRGKKRSLSRDQAMAQLKEVVTASRPDNYEPKIIKETPEYLYVEYKSPSIGFIDDVEFYINEARSEVEYRSASRWGNRDFDVNRKRIRALRKELEKQGWVSVGF